VGSCSKYPEQSSNKYTDITSAFAPVLVLAVSFGHYTIIRGETLTASIAFVRGSKPQTSRANADNTDCYIRLWRYVPGRTHADCTEFRYAIISVPQLLTDALQEIVSIQRISAFLHRPDVQYLDKLESASTIAEENKPLVVVGDIAWAELQEGMNLDSAPFVLQDLDITFQRGTVTLIAGKFGSGKSLLLNALLGEVALLSGHISYAVSSVVDPWQVETAIDWGQCLDGLAFVPQVSCAKSLSRPQLITRLPGSRA